MTTQTTTSAPAWWRTFGQQFRAGSFHSFILHGNVHDYVQVGGEYARLLQYLILRLTALKDHLIVVVDPARGLQFPVTGHRRLFVELLKLNENAAPPSPGGLGGAVRGNQPQTIPAEAVKLPTSLNGMTALIDRLLSENLRHPTDKILDPATGEPEVFDVLDENEQPTGRKETRFHEIRATVIFLRGDMFFPDWDARTTREDDKTPLARLLSWSRDLVIGQRHKLFILAETLISMHSELRRDTSRWSLLEVGRPDTEARLQYIDYRLGRLEADGDGLELPDLDPREFARIAGILTLEQIEDVSYAGVVNEQRLDRSIVLAAKKNAVDREFGEICKIDDARWKFSGVGGYRQVKRNMIRYVTQPWLRGGGLTVPAILFSGPAGTGKTQLAEAIAGEAGVPFVQLDLARLLGGIVGTSEKNFDRFKRAVMSLGSCVVFIDELDQAFKRGRGSDGGSQVDARLFGMLLAWMEDPARMDAGVLVIGATNYPNTLDGALYSRFSMSIPILPPNDEDRAEILWVLVERHMEVERTAIGANTMIEAVERTAGWVGRDIRALCLTARSLVEGGLDDDEPLTPDRALLESLSLILPKRKDVAEQVALALASCSDLRFLPSEWRARAIEQDQEAARPAPTAAPTDDATLRQQARKSRREVEGL